MFIYYCCNQNCTTKVKVKVIPQQAEVALGVPGRLRPRIFLTFGSHKHRPPLPQEKPWYSLSEAESTLGHMVPSGGVTEKNSQ